MFRTLSKKVVIDPSHITPAQRKLLLMAYCLLPEEGPQPRVHFRAGSSFVALTEKHHEIHYEIEFKADLIYQGEIDAFSLIPQTEEVFNWFIKLAECEPYIPPGFYCRPAPDAEDGLYHMYDLKYGLNARQKADKSFRYDIVDESRHSSGQYGQVCVSNARHKRNYATDNALSLLANTRPRLFKFQREEGNYNVNPKKEFELMRKLGYFKARDFKARLNAESLVVNQFTMKMFRGENLDKLLADDRVKQQLSLTERLAISIRILRELDLHFHRADVLHRDLKGAHIIVERLLNQHCSVKLIDLGFSINKTDAIEDKLFSWLYSAPEVHQAEYCDLSDLYSAAVAIGEVFQDVTNRNYLDMNKDDFLAMRINQDAIDFCLSEQINMPAAMKTEMQSTLRSMTLMDLGTRMTLQAALVKFEKFRLDCYLTLARPQQADVVRDVHAIAVTLADQIRDDYHFHRNQARYGVERLQGMLLDAIHKIPEEPLAVRLFIDVLGIKYFSKLTSKSDLITLVKEVFDHYRGDNARYKSALGKLQAFKESIKGTDYYYDYCEGLDLLLKGADAVQAKIAAFEFDLDYVIELIKYMRNKAAELDVVYQYHQGRYDEQAKLDAGKNPANMK